MAMWVKEILGGDIISCHVNELPHWYNHIYVDGDRVFLDLTGDQFGRDPVQMSSNRLYEGRHTYVSSTRGKSLQTRYAAFKARLDDLKESVSPEHFQMLIQIMADSEKGLPAQDTLTLLSRMFQNQILDRTRRDTFHTLHYGVNPFTSLMILKVFVRMGYSCRDNDVGWYDFLDHVVNEVKRRGENPQQVLGEIYNEFYVTH